MEFRHPSWDDAGVFALLERHGAAYCVMSGAGLPCVLRATAPFVYVRLHGPDPDAPVRRLVLRTRTCGGGPTRIGEWRAAGKDVFAYFNNDGGGNAVRNAAALRRLLGESLPW